MTDRDPSDQTASDPSDEAIDAANTEAEVEGHSIEEEEEGEAGGLNFINNMC